MKITKGGQISIPASIRRRWRTSGVVLIDEGDRVVVEPVRRDSIDAAAGSLRGYFKDTDLAELRRAARTGEQLSAERKLER